MTYGRDEFEQDQMDRGRDRDDEEAYAHDRWVQGMRLLATADSLSAMIERLGWDEDTF